MSGVRILSILNTKFLRHRVILQHSDNSDQQPIEGLIIGFRDRNYLDLCSCKSKTPIVKVYCNLFKTSFFLCPECQLKKKADGKFEINNTKLSYLHKE